MAGRIKQIDKREFAKIALDKNFEIFVMFIVALRAPKTAMLIYFFLTSMLATL